ncbi:hypothetical protein RN001_008041 [Aquatica leii]|uniref:Nuclear pore protein n=1 Tax=Aquatica leii TaxID=1421715 RepID=A0AAN7P3R1_9COLE|nr:hypothetical protein RN001_008041 [Aquatica leii]
MDTSDFSELLQEAEKLTTTIEGVTELPKVERSLRQVLEDSHDLYARVAQSGTQDVQANLLLGSQGVDLPRIVQKLENISTKRSFEPLKPTYDTDVESYLENHLQNIVVGLVEEEFQRCAESAKKTGWDSQKSEWTQERMKIINAMTTSSQDLLYIGNHSSVFMEPRPSISNKLGYEESIFAPKLLEYIKTGIQGVKVANIFNEFETTVKLLKDSKISDMWEIMSYMTQIPPLPLNECPLAARYSKPIVQVLISQATRYLEDRYKTYMTNIINENLAEARRGGVPGTYSLVRSYVGIRLKGDYLGLQGGMVDDRPIWPVVYYCLRCGDTSAALYCLKKAGSEAQDVIKLLETRIKTPDSKEISKLESNLQSEYSSLTHNSTDPFQRIVYDILCCGNTLDEHSEVAKTADDYLWLKLSYLRINAERDDTEIYKNLQSTILEKYGEVHYNAVEQPHVYFQVLALTGQFEAALEFLGRITRYQIHGVHIAIALNELHMLALPRLPSAPLLSIDPADPKPGRRLNISRLILMYVQKFELVAPKEAVQYYYMLRNVENEKEKMFITCIIDLAMETRQYEMLFGKIQRSGLRSIGYLDQFMSNDMKIEDVAAAVGRALVQKGLFEDAIDLFDLANNHEEVLKLFCTLLPQIVALQSTEASLRQRLPVKVNEIASRYSITGYNCSASMKSSFIILKDLLTFFDQYHAKQYPQALQTLEEIGIIPLLQKEVESKVKAFERYSLEVSTIISDVVLAKINILFAEYQSIKSNQHRMQYQGHSQESQLDYLRQQAQALTSFAGMLPYHMPGDTNSRLVQMEILMH